MSSGRNELEYRVLKYENLQQNRHNLTGDQVTHMYEKGIDPVRHLERQSFSRNFWKMILKILSSNVFLDQIWNCDEVSILICKSLFLTNENLLRDVSRDTWRRHQSISWVKENMTLKKIVVRPTQRMTFDSYKSQDDDGVIECQYICFFFRVQWYVVTDCQSWCVNRKNRKRGKDESERFLSSEFHKAQRSRALR